MSIAEKLLIVADNIQKVYEAGQKMGGDYNSAYNEGYSNGYTAGEAKGYETGYADGQNDVPNMLGYASAIRFPNCNVFGKKEVVLNLGERITNLQNFINVSAESDRNTILEHLTINSLGLPTSMLNFIQCTYQCRDTVLKKLTLNFDTKNVGSFQNAFACLIALEEIDGTPLDLSSATFTTNMFQWNSALKEVRFKENTIKLSISFPTSTNLSVTSIQSIIDGLADLTGLEAQTITFPSSIVLTDEQKAIIASKNWTLVQ